MSPKVKHQFKDREVKKILGFEIEFDPVQVYAGDVLGGGQSEISLRNDPTAELGYILWSGEAGFGISQNDHHLHVPKHWIDLHNRVVDLKLVAALSTARKDEQFFLYLDGEGRALTWLGQVVGYATSLFGARQQFQRGSVSFEGRRAEHGGGSELYRFACTYSTVRGEPRAEHLDREKGNRRRFIRG